LIDMARVWLEGKCLLFLLVSGSNGPFCGVRKTRPQSVFRMSINNPARRQYFL
jgi:hypothetical protein